MNKELIEFQNLRIEALEKLIDEQAKIIDEVQYKFKNAQAKYNILIRNITVIDEIIERPIKN